MLWREILAIQLLAQGAPQCPPLLKGRKRRESRSSTHGCGGATNLSNDATVGSTSATPRSGAWPRVLAHATVVLHERNRSLGRLTARLNSRNRRLHERDRGLRCLTSRLNSRSRRLRERNRGLRCLASRLNSRNRRLHERNRGSWAPDRASELAQPSTARAQPKSRVPGSTVLARATTGWMAATYRVDGATLRSPGARATSGRSVRFPCFWRRTLETAGRGRVDLVARSGAWVHREGVL